jgi:hypothetical protein
MNKLEKELLESQLVRFHQTQLNGLFIDRSLGLNMLLIFQKYLDLKLQSGWGNTKLVKQIRSFVNTSFMDTILILSQLEKEVKNNDELN